MLDSIYHRILKYLKSNFWLKIMKILPSFTQLYNGRHSNVTKSVNNEWFINFIA